MRNTLLIFLFCIGTAHAQSDIRETIANTITVEGLKKDLSIIASPEMEGRATGMPGQHKAAAYIESRMKAMGLKRPQALKSHQQNFSLFIDSLISCQLLVNGIRAAADTDYVMEPGPNEDGKYSSREIIFVGYGIRDSLYDDYAGMDVKGKTLLMFQGEPKKDGKSLISVNEVNSDWVSDGQGKKIELASSLGAAGVIMVNANQEAFAKPYTDALKRPASHLSGDEKKKMVNYALVSHSFLKKLFPSHAENWLAIAAKSAVFSKDDKTGFPIEIEMSYQEKVKELKSSNVLGMVEGTDRKDQFVFLTAHYDHLGKRGEDIYHGADDDGSGTAAVLQMAEAFCRAKNKGHGPRRTVVFMTVSGEERGLWGSRYYSDNPLFALDKTSVDLNTDMIGRIDTERNLDDTLNYVYVIGHDKISTELGALNESVNKKYTGLVLDYKFDDPKDPNRIFFRSDHYNFARKGVPILFFYDGMLKGDYHKPTDTIDKIYWELYLKRARMIFHTAWEIANRDDMLARDLPMPGMTR